MRKSVIALLCAATLSACDQPSMNQYAQRNARSEVTAPAEGAMDKRVMGLLGGAEAPADALASPPPPSQAQSGESYVYDHTLTISMASDFIKARFERARDRCQNDPVLKCKVMSASFQLLGEPDAPLPVANLTVALPHDAVATFEGSVLVALPNENKVDVLVKARNTSAQNVTNQVKDIESRLSQLTNYRERMIELSKRGGAKTDDLIKIEGEISRTQSEIEQIEGQRRDLAERIAKENLSISFQAQSTASDAFQPVSEVWGSSLRVLGASTAGVLMFVIGVIPWLPVLVGAFFLIRWLWRRMRRKPA